MRMYSVKEMFQFTNGKCSRCATFWSRSQKTYMMLKVAEVTRSVKSPPGGETAPTIVVDSCRSELVVVR